MTKLLFIVLSPLLFGQSLERVENGTTVTASQSVARSVAMLRFSNGSVCSSSFLTRTMLVTAAHCTYNQTPAKTTVFVVDSSGKSYSVKAKRVITHPEFELRRTSQGTMVRNDIALVELQSLFPISVRPLQIGTIGDMREKERNVTIVGYGRNSQSGSGVGVLRSGNMMGIVEPMYYFFNREGLYMEPVSNQVACPGDSGGAVLKGSLSSLSLIGVNSLSNGCKGAFGAYSISEVLPHHRTWIRGYIPGI